MVGTTNFVPPLSFYGLMFGELNNVKIKQIIQMTPSNMLKSIEK